MEALKQDIVLPTQSSNILRSIEEQKMVWICLCDARIADRDIYKKKKIKI